MRRIPLVLSFLAILVIFFATHQGIAVSPDVDFYFAGARSFLSGAGYTMPYLERTPILNYPPLTSFIFACIAALFRTDLYEAARIANAVLLAASTFTIYWTTLSLTRSVWAAICSALLLCFANDLILVHIRAWSEPAFIAAGLACLHCFSLHLSEGKRKSLILASFFAVIAVLSRYVAVTLILTVTVFLALERVSIRDRIKNLFCFNAMPAIALGLWMLRNRILSGQATNRIYHPGEITWRRVMIYLDQAAGAWFLPVQFPGWVRAGFFLLICLFLTFAYYRVGKTGIQDRVRKSWLPFLIFPVIFYAFLNFTQLTTGDGYPDDYAPEYRRYFSTIHGPFLVGAITITWHYLSSFSKKSFPRFLGRSALVLLVLLTVARGSVWVAEAFRNGHNGSDVAAVRGHPMTDRIRALSPETPVYLIGNTAANVPLLAFRTSNLVPGTLQRGVPISSIDSGVLEKLENAYRNPNAVTLYRGENLELSRLIESYPVLSRFDVNEIESFPDGNKILKIQSRGNLRK